MGKSRKKTKIFGNAKDARGSDKQDKQICNRILRHRIRQGLKTCQDWDSFVPAIKEEAWDNYNFSSDGKTYWEDADERSLRK